MHYSDFPLVTFHFAAILKLETDIGICAVNSPEVQPVCLPERGLLLPDWTECEISGYGKDTECELKKKPKIIIIMAYVAQKM